MFTITNSYVHIRFAKYVYCTFVFLTIPIIFNLTKNIKIDRFIGELSYPIYISHILIFNLVRVAGFQSQGAATIIGTILLSVILVKLVGDPIEKIRQRRVKTQKGVQKEPDALSVKFDNL